MLQRGVIVSYETVRRWCAKFGQAYANGLRRRRPRPEDKWQGKAGPISVPRLERSSIRPASIETRACHLSYFGSPAHPGSSAGSDTGAASIGSGSVHVTAHAFHPARPSANRVRVRTRLPARPRQVSALQHLAGGCVLSSWRTSRQRSRTPGCPGSRVVRSDVAAAHRPQRISPNPAVPPVRPKDLNQYRESGRDELLLAVRCLDLGLLVRQ